MIRAIALTILVATLAVLLIYSQQRREPQRISGFIEADEIRLGSRVGGRVAEVLVHEGEHVHRGQTLLRLEPFDLQQRLDEAKSQLAAHSSELRKHDNGLREEEIAQAKFRVDRLVATVAKLRAGPRPEEIAAAAARLTLAQAQLDRAKKYYDRTMELNKRDAGAVARDEFDHAVENFAVAEATVQVRSEELRLLQSGTRAEDIAAGEAELAEAKQASQLAEKGYRYEDIEQARAAVAAATAAVNMIEVQLAELDVKAEAEGTVDALELRPGDLVPPNAPVVSLIDNDHLWVRAYLPENKLQYRVGDPFRVTIDSFPNESFTAELSFVSTQAEFTPRNVQTPDERSKQVFRIKLRFGEDAKNLRPGMSADVWLK